MKPESARKREWKFVAVLAAWLAWTVSCPAAMTLLNREMFATSGKLTAESPGAFSQMIGTFYQRAGGPRSLEGAAASADLQGEQAAGVFDFGDEGQTKVVAGAWFYIKSIGDGESKFLSLGDRAGNYGPTISSTNGQIGAGIPYLHWTPCPINVKNRWVYLGIGICHKGGGSADVKFYYKLQGGPLTSWAEFEDGTVWISAVNWFRVSYEANPPGSEYRIGAPSAYAFEMADFSDVVYPPELLEPVSGLTWYCNPATGNDANDGTAPDRAWATTAKINAESRHTGMFPADDHAQGDTLVIDTSGAALEVPSTSLSLRTEGLTVRAADTELWIRIKSYRTIAPGGWNATATPKVFATTDTTESAVLWEDDKFMHHPTGTNFAAVASALSSTPGSFWTDGTTLYVHPFGSTDPRTDGKRYERSYPFDEGMAVALAVPNLHVRDIHAGKTCLAGKAANVTLQNYCMGTRSVSGSTLIEHCYLYYGSNHNLGLVQGAVGDSVIVDGVQCEQGSPYVGAGGQTVFVSFVGGPSDMGIVHSYRNCVTVANCGEVGSTTGRMRTDLPVFYSHNITGSNQFAKFEFVNCDFGEGSLQGDAVAAVTLSGTRCGALVFGANVEVDRCELRKMPVNVAGFALRVRNSLFVLGGVLGRSSVAGTVEMQGCTFDASGISSVQGGVPEAALFTRAGPLSLTFQNNAVIMPPGAIKANVFGHLRSTDVLSLSHNGYHLSGSVLSYQYHDGTVSANRGLEQWQALGFDEESFSSADLKVQGYLPLPGSPLVDAGLDFGPSKDYLGNALDIRNDIGALEAPMTFEYWQARQFSETELEDPEMSAPDAAYGTDGVENLLKFAFGIAPQEDSSARLPQAGEVSTELSLIYVRLRDAAGVRYEVEESADLSVWWPAQVQSEQVLAQEGNTETVRIAVAAGAEGRKFLRLRVRLN